ncbi:glycoside hydrolase family 3 N-terminal domain-containing protein [Flavobacterium sp. ASW18X]|uniref:glycoside hydrolase family 3 N-terminal domain-containing protein n=1 Tax=Flavobacterium sp. ASW18X TaxID=2572595 RepID=UPI0010AEA926|nr:glycoside hydrolase family 3 N-terminal domain-containing protein [Flavobacterium sp. ASW18X]TKD59119.1 beta-N-acetylglucosaminidase [Flavobacterium sp. ASW18X]
MKQILVFYTLTLLYTYISFAQIDPLSAKDTLAQKAWVNTKYNAMSLEERIGQLFMVSVASDQNKTSTDKIKQQIEQYHIGGVIFSKGGPVQQAILTNQYQAASNLPLLIGQDAEWGLAMRLDSTFAYPWNMTLGAIQKDDIVAQVGKHIGEHAKRLGVHINFAPDLDVNINPKNPIIGNRSFGEHRVNVVRKAVAFTKGMESAGVLASGKHFPGHGDTATDSHKSLPFLDFSKERLDSIELYPFKKMIDTGISSIMVAHLNIPALEPKKGLPSSLSKKIIKEYLKGTLQYKGLVFTDALNMKAVSEFAPKGEVELSAFLAGNDMLLMPVDVASAHAKMVEAYHSGRISEARLESSVKKILKAKYKVGLNTYRPVVVAGLVNDLHTIEDDLLYENAIENAITVVKNNFSILPVRRLDNKKIAYVKFGDASGDTFLNTLKTYVDVDVIQAKDIAEYREQLRNYNLVVIGFHKSNASPWKAHKFSENEKYWVQEIARMRSNNTILSVFTKPYALLDIQDWSAMDGIVMAYQNSAIAQEKAAEVIFGAIGAKGKLPVTAHPSFKVGTGINTKPIARLGFSMPERVGFDRTKLKEVDKLVQAGLDSLMYPGAQVLIARKGKVIYNKSFGKPIYETNDSITNNHLFDLASVTKILGTLPLVMKMEEEGKIELDNTFQELIPAYKESELKDVTVLKALSHYGRLPAWIAFYVSTLDDNRKPSDFFYRREPSPDYSTKVFDGMYLSNAYKDSIYNRIGRQELKSNKYRYSDVAYYVMKHYIENTYGERLDALLNRFLLKPIGATHTAYNPIEQFPRAQIVPTEEDNYYRFKRVQGYVHDMGAAMQGGVGGHAGLFSNALDVAKIMQMYLQGGYYGGHRFFNERTVKKFNTCYFCDEDVRRGVGFDKPQLKNSGPTCGCVSRESFGHSGFTGTYTWADPEEELVYVFLSNRTYPTMTNNLLVKSGLRTRIQQAIYDSLIN